MRAGANSRIGRVTQSMMVPGVVFVTFPLWGSISEKRILGPEFVHLPRTEEADEARRGGQNCYTDKEQ